MASISFSILKTGKASSMRCFGGLDVGVIVTVGVGGVDTKPFNRALVGDLRLGLLIRSLLSLFLAGTDLEMWTGVCDTAFLELVNTAVVLDLEGLCDFDFLLAGGGSNLIGECCLCFEFSDGCDLSGDFMVGENSRIVLVV